MIKNHTPLPAVLVQGDLAGWITETGTPDGIFDSGQFMPGESWSYTFEETGTFTYYCIIHPWMEGIVIVESKIPDYPHDATGKELTFPLLQYTPAKTSK